MNDNDKKDLLYRPESSPSRNYLSDGTVEHQNIPYYPIDTNETIDKTPGELKEEFQEIAELIKDLPEELHFLEKTIQKIKDRIDIVWPDGIQKKEIIDSYIPETMDISDTVNIVSHPDASENPNLKTLPALFPPPSPIEIKLETPRTLVQIIKDTYNRDQIQLDKYYAKQLQTIMQQYFQQMLAAMADCGMSSIDDMNKDFDGDAVKVPHGKGLEHLKDFICRSQVSRNQKSRLFHKTHAIDNTLMHLRAWHAAEAQRERYYSEKYKDSANYTESHSNALLRESRALYDSAYSSALYNMYKYLNSSVMIVNDVLNMTVKEAQAKAMLLKSGVNIFASSDDDIAAAEISAATSANINNQTSQNNVQKQTQTDNSDIKTESSDAINVAMHGVGGGFGGGL